MFVLESNMPKKGEMTISVLLLNTAAKTAAPQNFTER